LQLAKENGKVQPPDDSSRGLVSTPRDKIASKPSAVDQNKIGASKYSHLAGTIIKRQDINSNLADIDFNKVGITSIDDLKELKYLLQSDVGIGFNTNILRIALNFQEEKIAR